METVLWAWSAKNKPDLGNFLSGMETTLDLHLDLDILADLGNFLSGMETRDYLHSHASPRPPWKLP